MKWMMSILTAAFMTTGAGVAAQSGSSMNQDKKMDGMAKMAGMDATYTGCIEAAGSGKFTLAHAVAATGGMAADSMKEPSMKKNEMATATMKKDTMMSSTLTLSSTTVDLSKHVGQKVSVTGSLAPTMTSMDKGATAKEPAGFTVNSLNRVSGSCS
jgi:ABC-type iron transport system FetAB permease component